MTRPTSIPGVETFHRREDWEDPTVPVDGPASTLEYWDTFPLHYTAAPDMPDGDVESAVAGMLRRIQADYESNRGYSIGYLFAVDQRGGVWELRGFDIRSAANRGWNHRTCPVLCLVDGADPLTGDALRSVRALLREANERTGRTLETVGHRDIGATACPGDGIYRQIQRGLVVPLTDSEIGPDEGDDEMIDEYVVQPPAGREGLPWFYLRGADVRVATGREVARVNNGVLDRVREDGPDAAVRYDLLHESVLGRQP